MFWRARGSCRMYSSGAEPLPLPCCWPGMETVFGNVKNCLVVGTGWHVGSRKKRKLAWTWGGRVLDVDSTRKWMLRELHRLRMRRPVDQHILTEEQKMYTSCKMIDELQRDVLTCTRCNRGSRWSKLERGNLEPEGTRRHQ